MTDTIKRKHQRAYMECAYAFARCSDANRSKVGCIIVKDTRIISEGYNGLPAALDGPLEDENNVTRPEVRHAEENALKKLIRNHETSIGASMFITHAPCYKCSLDIVDAKIDAVFFAEFKTRFDGLRYLKNNRIRVYHLTEKSINRVDFNYIDDEENRQLMEKL